MNNIEAAAVPPSFLEKNGNTYANTDAARRLSSGRRTQVYRKTHDGGRVVFRHPGRTGRSTLISKGPTHDYARVHQSGYRMYEVIFPICLCPPFMGGFFLKKCVLI